MNNKTMANKFFDTISLMLKRIPEYFTLIFIVLLSTFTAWLPFLLHSMNWLGLPIVNSSFDYIYRNFDGLLYIIPAKTGYDPAMIQKLGLDLTPVYFAAHLPLYPALIKMFSFIGYLKSMLLVNVLFTVILSCFFYYIVKTLKITSQPLILSIVLLFLPRFLIVRSVGAPESLFLFLIIASLFFFEKKDYLLASILGALSVTVKLPGILLFPVYGLVFLEEYWKTKQYSWNWSAIFLIPIGLLGTFLIYLIQYHDFFAYFHTGGVVPMSWPFSMFNANLKWVGSAWLEDILFYFFLYTATAIQLWQSKYRSFFYFTLVFLIATTLVQHRDIARYSLPMWPLACIAFERYFTSKKFLLALLILIPAIYLYAWNFIIHNVMPVANWQQFM